MLKIVAPLLLITYCLAIEPVKIEANTPFSNEILALDTHYLKFHYEKSSKDVALVFSITSPSVRFFISAHSKCTPVNEKCADYSG